MADITQQFRQIDSAKTEQRVHITFRREVMTDESPDLSFLEQDYADVNPRAEREKYKAQDRERLAAYNRGEWYMTGVRVVADVLVPIGGNSFRSFSIASGGLWGVESDCGESYLAEIEADEKAELISNLVDMGAAFATLKAEGGK